MTLADIPGDWRDPMRIVIDLHRYALLAYRTSDTCADLMNELHDSVNAWSNAAPADRRSTRLLASIDRCQNMVDHWPDPDDPNLQGELIELAPSAFQRNS